MFQELEYEPTERAYFIGALIRAIRTGQPVRVRTPYMSSEEFPRELRMLIDPGTTRAASGVGASLGWMAGRFLGKALAMTRVAGGTVLLGASLLSLVIGAVLRIYSFRVAAQRGAAGELMLEGVPRVPRR